MAKISLNEQAPETPIHFTFAEDELDFENSGAVHEVDDAEKRALVGAAFAHPWLEVEPATPESEPVVAKQESVPAQTPPHEADLQPEDERHLTTEATEPEHDEVEAFVRGEND